MASFVKLDNTNTVLEVIGISNEICGEPTLAFPDTDSAGRAFIANVLKLEGTWLQTSFNSNFRKQYAGIGYTYDESADVFVTPKPFPSWVLDENYDWQAPIEYPADGNQYAWDEDEQDWVKSPAI
jgi:hypothetical protein